MNSYDVYQNPTVGSRDELPFVVDVQSDAFEILTTRVVIPLARAGAMRTITRGLNPSFVIAGLAVVMATPLIAAIPLRLLGQPVGSLAEHRYEILGAIDLLLTGV